MILSQRDPGRSTRIVDEQRARLSTYSFLHSTLPTRVKHRESRKVVVTRVPAESKVQKSGVEFREYM